MIQLLHSCQGTEAEIEKAIADVSGIHRRLWELAVANARRDMNSPVVALFIGSLKETVELHTTRVGGRVNAG